jgi:hypothetical protein
MTNIEDAPKWKRFKVDGDSRVFVMGVVGSGDFVSVIEFKSGVLHYPDDDEPIPMFKKGTKITFI